MSTLSQFGVGNSAITNLTALQSINGGQLAGLRNLVINGNGRVQQRAAATLTATVNFGTVDRMLFAATGGTGVAGTINSAGGYATSNGTMYGLYSASFTNGQPTLQHRIESLNTKHLSGKTVTVSGVLQHDFGASHTINVRLDKAGAVDNFGTSSVLATSANITIPSGGLGTPFSFTTTLPAGAGDNGINVLVYTTGLHTVAAKFWFVGDLQLEIGSTATPFEQRPYGLELALCQRYYQYHHSSTNLWSGNATTANVYYLSCALPTTMRAVPTISGVTSFAQSGFGLPTYSSSAQGSAQFQATATNTGVGFYYVGFNGSAEL